MNNAMDSLLVDFYSTQKRLHAVLTRLKSQPQVFTNIELAYSASDPISNPIVLTLPTNDIRLRFDGPDQRLRLIEIVGFSKSTFTYKSNEVVRRPSSTADGSTESTSFRVNPFCGSHR